MALIEVKVPDIGDFDEVAVIELLVKVGDTVKVEQSLITVESDKASMEIPSSTAGVVKEIKVALGDKVNIGDFKDVAVIEVLVKPGDIVKVEQSLITVESDKASMEIPSSAAGVIKELKVKLGDKVNIGDLLAVVVGAASAAAPVAAATA